MLPPRRIRTDLLVLGALCAVACFVGLTSHGLTNWQEAMRALVAREMQERREWLLPTIAGVPYLAKPPMVYWCQLALSRVVGGRITELELRLTAALAASAGVLVTYLVGRVVLRSPGDVGNARGNVPSGEPRATATDHWPEHAAFWGAAMLATGVLFVRSARIGELDVLLVAPTVLWIGALVAGSRASASVLSRAAWLGVATLSACVLTLTKGPPALLTPIVGAALPLIVIGVRSRAPRRVWSTLLPTFFVPTLAGLGAFSLWASAAAARAGEHAARAMAREEVAENLQLFVPRAPVRYLEAMSYGVGLGSICAIVAIVWLVKDRREVRARAHVGWWVVACWAILPMLALSLVSKGVPRYLTPAWPGVALLGGMWLASAIRDLRAGRWLARGAGAIIVVLAVGQSWWYGVERERRFADRSPRAMVGELLAHSDAPSPHMRDLSASDVVAIDLWTPALDFYAGGSVDLYMQLGPLPDDPRTPASELPGVDALRERVARQGSLVALVRSGHHPENFARAAAGEIPPSPLDALQHAGFRTLILPIESPFTVDNGKTRVSAILLTPLQNP
ncbi:MAG: hypothetical protein RBS39_00125 [Phycisphaerales bacterium]|nr:hypothetical protein [Phycisphaerales bacterium]